MAWYGWTGTLDAPNVLYGEHVYELRPVAPQRIVAASCTTVAVLSRELLARAKYTAFKGTSWSTQAIREANLTTLGLQMQSDVSLMVSSVKMSNLAIAEGTTEIDDIKEKDMLQKLSLTPRLRHLFDLPPGNTDRSEPEDPFKDWLIFPNNRRYLYWQVLIMFIVSGGSLNALWCASQAAYYSQDYIDYVGLWIFFDVILLVDNIMRATLVCSVTEGVGDIVTDRAAIRRRYIENSLFLDIIGKYIYPPLFFCLWLNTNILVFHMNNYNNHFMYHSWF